MLNDSKDLANRIRIRILEASYRSGASTHIGGALSMADLLATLYGGVLNFNLENKNLASRDRFILSKGHGALGLYSVLVEKGFISESNFETFMQNGTTLIAHPIMNPEFGIESSNGSLGQGLSFGVGQALAMKLESINNRIFVMLGDGECDEGSVWEAAMSASHFKLDNLVAVIDMNGFQNDGSTNEVVNQNDLAQKWVKFGWNAISIDGHNLSEILNAFSTKTLSEVPTVIVARTIKGKGVDFMENNNNWHHNRLTRENFEIAIQNLNRGS